MQYSIGTAYNVLHMHGHEIGVRAGGMVTANQMRVKTNARSGPFSDRTIITIGRRRRTSSSALAHCEQRVPVLSKKAGGSVAQCYVSALV